MRKRARDQHSLEDLLCFIPIKRSEPGYLVVTQIVSQDLSPAASAVSETLEFVSVSMYNDVVLVLLAGKLCTDAHKLQVILQEENQPRMLTCHSQCATTVDKRKV